MKLRRFAEHVKVSDAYFFSAGNPNLNDRITPLNLHSIQCCVENYRQYKFFEWIFLASPWRVTRVKRISKKISESFSSYHLHSRNFIEKRCSELFHSIINTVYKLMIYQKRKTSIIVETFFGIHGSVWYKTRTMVFASDILIFLLIFFTTMHFVLIFLKIRKQFNRYNFQRWLKT